MPGGAKLGAPASTMLLFTSTFFIILSGVYSHQCHWCGPLAEQVHRSRRAPPCDEPGDHLTTCDPGYPYCAIVATSPPFVESRYCVRIYQDECYPLFCNSTKTWRMTCPCRGDLCNGANAEREIESFAVLSKLVSKTHNSRIKKRSTETENRSTDFSQIGESTTEHVLTNIVEPKSAGESSINNNEILNNSDVLIYVPGIDLNKDNNNLEEDIIKDSNQATVNTTYVEIPSENEKNSNLMQADDPMKMSVDIKSENIVTNTEMLHSKHAITIPTPEIIKENHTTPNTSELDVPLVKPKKTTNDVVEKKHLENETIEKLPTAEALQHNESQASKSTISDPEVKEVDAKTVTSAETTVLHTTASTLLTTLFTNTMNHPTNALPKDGKNGAPMLTGHIMLQVVFIFILRITL